MRQHIINTDNEDEATVIRLTPSGATSFSTFEEAFQGYSNAGGRERRRARRAKRKAHRKAHGSLFGNILTGGMLGVAKAAKNKIKAKRAAKSDNEGSGDDQSGSAQDDSSQQRSNDTPQNQAGYSSGQDTGGGSGSDHRSRVGNSGGAQDDSSSNGSQDTSSDEPSMVGDNYNEDQGDEDGQGQAQDDSDEDGESGAETGIDGSRIPNHTVKKLVNRIYEGKELLERLDFDNANFKAQMSSGRLGPNRKMIADKISANNDKMLGIHLKIEDLKKQVTDYCKHNGIQKDEVSYCQKLVRQNIGAINKSNGGSEKPVYKENILVEGSAFDGNRTPAGTGITALDDRNDYGYKPTFIELHSNADGANNKINAWHVVAGLALVGAAVYALYKYDVFKK